MDFKKLSKLFTMTDDKEQTKMMCDLSIEVLLSIVEQIEKKGFKDEQFVLDWADKVNEISIKF